MKNFLLLLMLLPVLTLVACGGDDKDEPKPDTDKYATRVVTVEGISFKMIKVEGGTYTMGAKDDDNDAWSSRYIESGSYLRLKSITLGYTLPRPLVSKLGMNSVRISLNATNLFTITGYDGYDPEIGASTASANVFNLDNGRYPSPTTVTFNLNLSF